MSRPPFTFLLKILVSLGLLSFLFSQIDLSKLLQALTAARFFYLLLGLMSYIISQFVKCFRWVLLARPLGLKPPFRQFLSFYFIGMFFNLFAPGTVGGDIGRVFYLARATTNSHSDDWTSPTAYALVSVIADRAIGIAVLVWMGAAALLAFPSYSLPLVLRYLTFTLALGFLLGWMLLPRINGLLQWAGYLKSETWRIVLEAYWSDWRILRQTIILSLAAHFIQACIQMLLGWALDLNLPWSYCFILYPLVDLFSAIPISLNGMGMREGGYLFLLGQINTSPEKAIAFGLLWFVTDALASLLGGVVFLLRKRPTH